MLSPLLFIIVLDALSREMGMFKLNGSRASFSAITRKRVMILTEATMEDGNYGGVYESHREVLTINRTTV